MAEPNTSPCAPVGDHGIQFLRDGSLLSPTPLLEPLAIESSERVLLRVRRKRVMVDYIEMPRYVRMKGAPSGARPKIGSKMSVPDRKGSKYMAFIIVARSQAAVQRTVSATRVRSEQGPPAQGPPAQGSCHQCKVRQGNAMMPCGGVRINGRPCGLKYCRQCIDRQ